MKRQKGRKSKVGAKGDCRKSRERGGTVAGGLKTLAGDPPAWGAGRASAARVGPTKGS